MVCLFFAMNLLGQNIEKIELNKEYPNNKLDAGQIKVYFST